MRKTVEEYMSLPYTIEITPDEGSFFVQVKELPGCMSVGTTKSDALAMIEDAMREWLTVAVQDNLDIPLPGAMQTDRYSGKFPLRLPKTLHRKLSESADRDGVSLNSYIVMLLSERNALADIKRMVAALPHPSSIPLVDSLTASSGNLSGSYTVHEGEPAYPEKRGTARRRK